jgi:microcystin degradation protein MlrC
MNILIAGFQHETNTFAPSPADWPAFLRGDGFPAYREGADMLQRFADSSLPIGGFIRAARARGWQLLPACWAGATPSAAVSDEAFERIAGRHRGAAARPGRARPAGHLPRPAWRGRDGQPRGRRRRAAAPPAPGWAPRLPIVASLDLHANVSAAMLEQADALVAYRSYPHVDTAETGRARPGCWRAAGGGPAPALAWRRVPFLIPINAGCTLIEPAASLYARLPGLDATHATVSSIAMGFPAADIACCGPSVWAYGEQAEAVVQNCGRTRSRPRHVGASRCPGRRRPCSRR